MNHEYVDNAYHGYLMSKSKDEAKCFLSND